MKSKERVILSLKGKEPDRPPIFATVTPQIGNKLNDLLNIKDGGIVNSFFANRISFMKALVALGNDCVCVAANWSKGFYPKIDEDGNITDAWGIKWQKTGIYDEMIKHPLSNVSNLNELDEYSFPDPMVSCNFDHAEKQIDKYGEDYAIIGEQECTIFELSWYLVGLEKFLPDLLLEKDYVFELMDRVMEFNLAQASRLVEMGVDIIWTGDDMGNQNGMMIDPDLWRKIFKPRMEYVFSKLKSINPKIKIAYHSCGSIRPIIPDLIEIGLDILNPLQTLAKNMNANSLKEEFGDKLSFFGGIDIQNLLPRGTPDEIMRTVKEIKGILGKNGGYILAPAHNIQPDTPIENIMAFFEEAKKI